MPVSMALSALVDYEGNAMKVYCPWRATDRAVSGRLIIGIRVEVAASEENDICQDLVLDVVGRTLIVDNGRPSETRQVYPQEVILGNDIH